MRSRYIGRPVPLRYKIFSYSIIVSILSLLVFLLSVSTLPPLPDIRTYLLIVPYIPLLALAIAIVSGLSAISLWIKFWLDEKRKR